MGYIFGGDFGKKENGRGKQQMPGKGYIRPLSLGCFLIFSFSTFFDSFYQLLDTLLSVKKTLRALILILTSPCPFLRLPDLLAIPHTWSTFSLRYRGVFDN